MTNARIDETKQIGAEIVAAIVEALGPRVPNADTRSAIAKLVETHRCAVIAVLTKTET